MKNSEQQPNAEQQQALNKADVMCRYPLATKTGIELMLGYLMANGAMCPKCGYGTRKTSKRWARCKRCNERVQLGGNGT